MEPLHKNQENPAWSTGQSKLWRPFFTNRIEIGRETHLSHPRGSSIQLLRSELIQISMIFQLTTDVGNVGKERNKLKTYTQHRLGIVGLPYSSFYHVNKAHGTLWAGQFPSRHLGPIQLPCILGPQWGMYFRASVLIYLEWQLKGHKGPHLMTATITRVQDGGKKLQPGALHINGQNLSQRLIMPCVCDYSRALHSAADCCTHSATRLCFPREESRLLLLSNVWFIKICNSTSVKKSKRG